MRRLLLPVAAALLVASGASCREERFQRVLPPGVRVDAYAQSAAKKIDVLWVVDNSGSMAAHQDNLARNFRSFIDAFSQGGVDFRLGITTTDIFRDAGRFRGPVLTPETPGLQDAFATAIRVGTDGSAYEAGLEAARLALDRQRRANQPATDAVAACRLKCPAGRDAAACQESCVAANPVPFLRPDAFLYIVFVTDEEDRSSQDVRGFYREFMSAKGVGNDGMVTTAAIMGDVPAPACDTANPGTRYKQLSDLTGGEVGSICDAEFATALERLANNAIGLKRRFALEEEPDLDTLEVFVRLPCDAPDARTARCAALERAECQGAAPDALGLVCTPRQGLPDGWVYEEGARVVYFAGASVPGVPAQVELQYFEKGSR
jgi:hypothetical protein